MRYWEADFFSNCLIRSLNLAAISYSSSEIAFSKASLRFSRTTSSEASLVNSSCRFPGPRNGTKLRSSLENEPETVSGWNITPETVCCCNSDASNYSEDGWNCDSEDDTYCVFD